MTLSRSLLAATLCLFVASTVNAQVGKNQHLLNPNLATQDDLSALPEISPDLAKKIIDGRPFLGMDKLHALLSGSLSSEQMKKIYLKLFVPINLNTEKKEVIGLIPGIGKRMIHEFEEYRPYKAMAQFRREMGKYVDKETVAKFEQYVFVPLDLNKAKPEDFATIPGVGKKMLHEFMEYRPYKAMAQFRREMGKYVSKDEVARLERYVFVDTKSL